MTYIICLHGFKKNVFFSFRDTSAGYESFPNLGKLMTDLSIMEDSDLRVILGIASKIDSTIIRKVYGDRNFPAAEFAAELITV